MKHKEITIRTRKGLNVELDSSIQPGAYKEVDLFEFIINGEVQELDEVCDHKISFIEEISSDITYNSVMGWNY
jgi:hypothetical protein